MSTDQAPRLSDDELTTLLAEHDNRTYNCGGCLPKFVVWPCETWRLATEVRELRTMAKAGAQTDRDHETLFQDLEEEPCRFDHNGFCQSHYWTGSEPNKCGLAEAKERWNAFLAALARYEEGGRE